MSLHSWKVRVRLEKDGYSEGDMCVSGGYYHRFTAFYVVATSKASAMYQAKLMAGWSNPSRTNKNIASCIKIEDLIV